MGIIVVGPRNLPPMMRTAGQWVARLRRMTTDLRSQSGIDDILRQEGLDEHIHQLRSLSRLNVVESLIAPVAAPAAGSAASAFGGTQTAQQVALQRNEPLREREYPLIGCDSYGALPDDAPSYRMMALQAKASPAAEPSDSAEDAKNDAAADAKNDAAADAKNDAAADAKNDAAADAKNDAPDAKNDAAPDAHDEAATADVKPDPMPEPAADPGAAGGSSS
ncbi:Twin-arginine translocation protein TatB [Minicystis rosea]|nr:Twin-arginine translocation protein TatB [Minicystis rosea]